MRGFLSTYWEQGMEEMPWQVFQDERFVSGSSWDREGMHRLEPGKRLRVFGSDGTVLWEGRLESRRVGLFGRLHAGASNWFPAGIEQVTWEAWLRSQPPLRAELTDR